MSSGASRTNAGRSLPSASSEVSARGLSSVSTTVTPRRPLISTGTISFRNRPASMASTAFWWERRLNWSASALETWPFWAVYSACPPMWQLPKEHHRPS